jgi:hypothetical protein
MCRRSPLHGPVHVRACQHVPTMSAYGSCSSSLRIRRVDSSGVGSCNNSYLSRSCRPIAICISRRKASAHLRGCWVLGVDRNICVLPRGSTTHLILIERGAGSDLEHTRVRVAARRDGGKGCPAAMVTAMVTNSLAWPPTSTQLLGTGWPTIGMGRDDQAKKARPDQASAAPRGTPRDTRSALQNRCWLRGATVLFVYSATYGTTSAPCQVRGVRRSWLVVTRAVVLTSESE